MLDFIYKPVIWLVVKIKWLVSIWNTAADWNRLNLAFYLIIFFFPRVAAQNNSIKCLLWILKSITKSFFWDNILRESFWPGSCTEYGLSHKRISRTFRRFEDSFSLKICTRDYSKPLCLPPLLLWRLSFIGTVYFG